MAGLDQLSARERTLVGILGGTFVAIIVILAPLRVSAYLDKRQKQNADLRDSITSIQGARTRLLLRRSAIGDVAARYANKAPTLGTLVEAASKASGLEIVSQTDTQPLPRGKLYTERSTKLTIQKTGLKPLAQFMEKIESSGHPVAITAFSMSKRIEADSYTVEMTVTAYDRNDLAGPSGTTATGASSVTSGTTLKVGP